MVEPQEAKVLVLVDWDTSPAVQLAVEKITGRLGQRRRRLWTAFLDWLGRADRYRRSGSWASPVDELSSLTGATPLAGGLRSGGLVF